MNYLDFVKEAVNENRGPAGLSDQGDEAESGHFSVSSVVPAIEDLGFQPTFTNSYIFQHSDEFSLELWEMLRSTETYAEIRKGYEVSDMRIMYLYLAAGVGVASGVSWHQWTIRGFPGVILAIEHEAESRILKGIKANARAFRERFRPPAMKR